MPAVKSVPPDGTRKKSGQPARRASAAHMTPDDFRKLALSLPDAEERAHQNHPDFRVSGKIFATLGYPDEGSAMVKLYPAQQQAYVAADPKTFTPVKGAWGAKGCTTVHLDSANQARVAEALHAAWRNTAVHETLRSIEKTELAKKKRSRTKSAV
ncbi:MAG TPA: MmcQ/YjbR family DNA-binding protein [Acidobacteriaceae bacterium]|nr:MmcQ/YjbR family DNA-binding protein [Acidobacteriaceae bacterium]